MKFKIKKSIIIWVLAILVIGGFLFVPDLVFAQDTGTTGVDFGQEYVDETGLARGDPRVLAVSIIRIILSFLALVAVAIVIYGGWMYMTAEGEEDKVATAKKILINAIIGLIIILSAFIIVSFIINRMSDAIMGGARCETSGDCGGELLCCPDQICRRSCSYIPGGQIGFAVRGTYPRDESFNIPRNANVRAWFNRVLAEEIPWADNFNVIRIASVNSEIGEISLLDVDEEISGTAGYSSDKEAVWKADAICDNETSTPNCLSAWSQFEVTLNTGSGIRSVDNESLNYPGGIYKFIFSTDDSIDLGPPSVNIMPAQICQDDGTLKPEANTVVAWARDDIGLANLNFSYQDPTGDATTPVNGIMDAGNARYFTADYKYITADWQIGDTYELIATAYDAASSSVDSFSALVRPGHCCNGIQDIDEEGIDCGGADCLSCEGGPCNVNEPNQCIDQDDENCSDNLCATFFCNCETAGCICRNRPYITLISPQGGFCEDDRNQPCQEDFDCIR